MVSRVRFDYGCVDADCHSQKPRRTVTFQPPNLQKALYSRCARCRKPHCMRYITTLDPTNLSEDKATTRERSRRKKFNVCGIKTPSKGTSILEAVDRSSKSTSLTKRQLTSLNLIKAMEDDPAYGCGTTRALNSQ